jgi:hypothetical protein
MPRALAVNTKRGLAPQRGGGQQAEGAGADVDRSRGRPRLCLIAAAQRGRADPAAAVPARLARDRVGLNWPRLSARLELATIGAGYEAYSLVRLAVRASRPAAMAHAAQLWHTERWLHVRVEPRLNQALSWHPLLADAAGYYCGLAHFAVTAAVLAWLYLRRPAAFPRCVRRSCWPPRRRTWCSGPGRPRHRGWP